MDGSSDRRNECSADSGPDIMRFNPATPAELFCLRFSWNLDVLFVVGNWTLCICRTILKCFFLSNKWIFRKHIFVFKLMYFFYFLSNSIVFNIILKLRPSRTQNFLKYRNILGGSRDIRKRKIRKNSEVKIFWKNWPF